VVWRNAKGTSVAVRGKEGDGNFDGEVTQADYYVWKKHYGESEFGEGSGGDVPEPAGGLLWLLAIGAVSFFRGQRNRQAAARCEPFCRPRRFTVELRFRPDLAAVTSFRELRVR
jgi:hypothetical protein